MSFFSIIIPAYNVSGYLSKCLDSISSQIYDDYEVIIIDDDSQDDTYDIIKSYAERFSWIKYEKINHAPVGTVRNRAIDNASGDYLVFVDSDDVIEPRMLKEVYVTISRFSPDICFLPNHYIAGNDGLTKHDFMPLDDYPQIFESREKYIAYTFDKGGVVPTAMWTAVCKREVIEKYGVRMNPEYLWSQDTDFILQALSFSNKVSVCPYRGYIWNRSNIGSSTRMVSAEKVISRLEVYNKWIKALQTGCFGTLSGETQEAFEKMLLRNYCEVLFIYSFIKRFDSRRKIRKKLMDDALWNKDINLVPREYYRYGLKVGRLLFVVKHYFGKILGNNNG